MTIKNIVALAALLAVLAAGDAFLLARVDAWGAAVLALQAALVAALVCLFLRQASLNRARREEDPAMALFPLPARFRLLRRGETPGRRPDAAWREARSTGFEDERCRLVAAERLSALRCLAVMDRPRGEAAGLLFLLNE